MTQVGLLCDGGKHWQKYMHIRKEFYRNIINKWTSVIMVWSWVGYLLSHISFKLTLFGFIPKTTDTGEPEPHRSSHPHQHGPALCKVYFPHCFSMTECFHDGIHLICQPSETEEVWPHKPWRKELNPGGVADSKETRAKAGGYQW